MLSFRLDTWAASYVQGEKLSDGGRAFNRLVFALATFLVAAIAPAPQTHAFIAAADAARGAHAMLGVGPPGAETAVPRSLRSGVGPIFVQAQLGFEVADIVGEPGSSIPIGIEMPPFQRTDYLVLSFRGLPEGFVLSSGFRTAEAWLVSAHEAKHLRLDPPAGFTGTFTLDVQLIRGRNVEPIVQTAQVSIQAKSLAQHNESELQETLGSIAAALDSDRGTASDEAPATISVKKAKRIDPAKERELMAMARSMLDQNDIAAARLIYTRLAREGSAQAALTLAQTYDAAFLSRYDITGLSPNAEKAKYWYGIAASLGSTDASGHLLALEGASRP